MYGMAMTAKAGINCCAKSIRKGRSKREVDNTDDQERTRVI